MTSRSIDREELAWAAGFFDGEGCFSYCQSAKYAIVRIAQAERQPLERFHDAVGFGKIYGPYVQRHKDKWTRKPQYSYQVTGHERVQAILGLLWIKLGTTKRAKAAAVLERATHCHRGHLKVKGHKGCGRCTADYWQSRRNADRLWQAEGARSETAMTSAASA